MSVHRVICVQREERKKINAARVTLSNLRREEKRVAKRLALARVDLHAVHREEQTLRCVRVRVVRACVVGVVCVVW